MEILTQTRPIQLHELTNQISNALAQTFGRGTVWVIADVSDHTFQPGYSRHFFELVEKDDVTKSVIAKVRTVAWSSGAARISEFEKITEQKFKAGIKVCVRVQVNYNPTFGLQLVVHDIDSSYTIGQLELHRQATIQKLLQDCSSYIQKEGDRFVTKNNSLCHATVIQRIAVISSSSSAGYADFMDALYRNKYGYKFRVNNYFTSVQGEANAEAATKKVEEICASGIRFDAVVMIRGGGADTDFLMFDQFNLCSAVARLPIPVITGIGHLKNQSIVDLVAHTATNAPTKAAEFIVAHNLAFETLLLNEQKNVVIRAQQILTRDKQTLLGLNAQLASRTRQLLARQKEKQERIKHQISASAKVILNRKRIALADAANKALNKPLLTLSLKGQELKSVEEKLTRCLKNFYVREQREIENFETIWRLMSPVNLLKRGFAMVYQNRKIISGGNHLHPSEEIVVRMQDAELTTIITDKKQTDGDNQLNV